MQEMQTRSLSQENLQEEKMATHSIFLPGKIPWTEEPVAYSPVGRKKSNKTERLSIHRYSRADIPSLQINLTHDSILMGQGHGVSVNSCKKEDFQL